MPPRRGELFDPHRFPFLEGWGPGGSAPIDRPEGTRHAILGEWSPNVRYKETGSIPAARAAELASVARTLVDEVVLTLWADGRLPDEALR